MHHNSVLARVIHLVIATAAFCSAGAQTQQPTWWDRLQVTYHKALEHGRPVAEKFAREFPKRFENLKQTAQHEIKQGQKALANADLDQKKNLALELWRIRESLDLATLFSAPVLKQLTGLDVPTLDDLRLRVTKTEKALQAQIAHHAIR